MKIINPKKNHVTPDAGTVRTNVQHGVNVNLQNHLILFLVFVFCVLKKPPGKLSSGVYKVKSNYSHDKNTGGQEIYHKPRNCLLLSRAVS
mmetsp:Transcript_14599/g.16667  ORF Transcript_14599/g.16667 Transcript_14599/m.16667 type:complete len:90 (-) Transcript_14599:716-985(-)